MAWPSPPEEFTPTFEEWLLSTVTLPNPYHMFVDRSGETAFYTGVNFSLLSTQLLIYGTDTAAAYRGMLLLRSMPQVFAASALSDAYDAGDGYRVSEESFEVRQGSRLTNPFVTALGSLVNRLT